MVPMDTMVSLLPHSYVASFYVVGGDDRDNQQIQTNVSMLYGAPGEGTVSVCSYGTDWLRPCS